MTEADGQATLDTFEVPARVQTRRADQPELPRTYFTEALRDYLLNRSDILGDTFQEREAALYRGGLEIHTTQIPGFQQMAEQARDLLPDTRQGFDAAMVSLDTNTGAIVAMVGGRGFVPGENEVNMALAPRQTGSSQKTFILAAALQAGATPDDIIDGTRPCVLPNPSNPSEPFEIRDAASRAPDTLRAMTWYSINCAYGRLAQIVGLNRVVRMTYAMAKSPYLYEGQPETDRDPLQPFPALATGANPMSPLDMASGRPDDRQRGTAHGAVLRRVHRRLAWRAGVLAQRPRRAGPRSRRRPAGGRRAQGRARQRHRSALPAQCPGRRQDRYPGQQHERLVRRLHPQLTTAVWVGDPDAYTPMVNVPEFDQDRVQGGLYPTQIWQSYMNNAHTFLPGNDWEAAPAASRAPQRLYLPGNECIYVITGYNTVVDPNATAPPAVPQEPAGFASPEAPPTTVPSGTTPPPGPPATVQVPVYSRVDSGTTIPPNVVDPRAPINTVPLDYRIGAC